MNTYIELEKNKVNAMISELLENAKTLEKNNPVVIIKGKSILKSEQEEYEALLKMQEILEQNFKESHNYEYLEELEKTKLPKLSDENYNLLKDPEYLIKKEKKLISDRKEKIISDYNMAGKNHCFQKAEDGKFVLNENIEEYNALLAMENELNSAVKNSNYYYYMDLRVQTALGRMSDLDYAYLKGDLSKINSVSNYSEKPVQTEVEVQKEEPENVIPLPASSLEEKPALTEQVLNDAVDTPEINMGAKEENFTFRYPDGTVKPSNPTNVIELPESEFTFKEMPQDKALEPIKDDKIPVEAEEEPVEVVGKKAWKWIKEHKKQILIALGITALTITVVIAISQLLPAIVAYSEASQISSLASQMVANSSMWHSATLAEQATLHSANTGLANILSGLTGMNNLFNAGTGVWTIGSQTLSAFQASSLAATTSAQAAQSAALLHTGILGGIGIGSLTAGLAVRKKSPEYKETLGTIKNLENSISSLKETEVLEYIKKITNDINANEKLSAEEKQKLLKKVQNITVKYKTLEVEKTNEPTVVDIPDEIGGMIR